jgi:hypothetical protein
MRADIAAQRPDVQYPQDGESVVSREYAVRVGSPDSADAVDVSIDQGPWLPCRRNAGYWWYDWSGYSEGEHEIIARTRAQNGRWRMSAPRALTAARAP